VQMQLYEHPLNDEREARGELPVNSFWLSGCGTRQLYTGEVPWVDDRLRRPALAEDWHAWLAAWQALDAGPLREAATSGQPVTLTLCGERSAVEFSTQPRSLWRRLQGTLRGTPALPLLLGL
jgi:hypothetical protein